MDNLTSKSKQSPRTPTSCVKTVRTTRNTRSMSKRVSVNLTECISPNNAICVEPDLALMVPDAKQALCHQKITEPAVKQISPSAQSEGIKFADEVNNDSPHGQVESNKSLEMKAHATLDDSVDESFEEIPECSTATCNKSNNVVASTGTLSVSTSKITNSLACQAMTDLQLETDNHFLPGNEIVAHIDATSLAKGDEKFVSSISVTSESTTINQEINCKSIDVSPPNESVCDSTNDFSLSLLPSNEKQSFQVAMESSNMQVDKITDTSYSEDYQIFEALTPTISEINEKSGRRSDLKLIEKAPSGAKSEGSVFLQIKEESLPNITPNVQLSVMETKPLNIKVEPITSGLTSFSESPKLPVLSDSPVKVKIEPELQNVESPIEIVRNSELVCIDPVSSIKSHDSPRVLYKPRDAKVLLESFAAEKRAEKQLKIQEEIEASESKDKSINEEETSIMEGEETEDARTIHVYSVVLQGEFMLRWQHWQSE